jgi:membrane protease YdiL (CAAX protease family)
MLTAKPWKTDAMMRLMMSLIVCAYAGTLLVATMHFVQTGGRHGWKLYPVAAVTLGCLGMTLYRLQRPWQLEGLVRQLVITMAWFYGAILLGAWAHQIAGTVGPSIGQMAVGALSFQGAALVLVSPFLRAHETSWTEGFGLAQRAGHALIIGVLMGCVFLPVGVALQWLSGEVIVRLPGLQLQPEEQEVVQTLRLASQPLHWTTLGLITVLLAPAAEEVLFRGLLYPWLKRTGHRWLAIFGSALLFGAIHANLATFLPLTVLALMLTVLYERTGNLLAPIAAHAVFNAVNFSRVYLRTVGS